MARMFSALAKDPEMQVPKPKIRANGIIDITSITMIREEQVRRTK